MADSINVLITDDEKQIRRLVKLHLETQGMRVYEAKTGEECIQRLQKNIPDLILLDLNLPDADGSEILRQIRQFSSVPVLILSVRNSERDIVELLNSGADDYLTKPFSLAELIARIKVILRRSYHTDPHMKFSIGALHADLETHSIHLNDQKLSLTPKEFSILILLMKYSGKIVTSAQIMNEIWGPGMQNETGFLRVYIANLRKKIESDPRNPRIILTEPAIGYRLGEM